MKTWGTVFEHFIVIIMFHHIDMLIVAWHTNKTNQLFNVQRWAIGTIYDVNSLFPEHK